MLGIDAGGLLLHGAERTGDSDGGKFPLCVFGNIHIGHQGNPIAVVESDLGMLFYEMFLGNSHK